MTKRWLLTAAMLAAAAFPAAAADSPQVAVGQDPLTRQILRSAARPNGGVASFAAVKGSDGQKVVIPLVNAEAGLNGASAGTEPGDALKPLAPAAGLAEKKKAGAADKAKVKEPSKQLKKIDERQGWER